MAVSGVQTAFRISLGFLKMLETVVHIQVFALHLVVAGLLDETGLPLGTKIIV